MTLLTPRTILFAAHDPGGANVLKPVVEAFSGRAEWRVLGAFLGPAAERIVLPNVERVALPSVPTPGFPNELSVAPEALESAINALLPDAVFTATSFNVNLERLAIRFANERGIPTASILDYWSRYAYRFTLNGVNAFPRALFVADNAMKREAEAEIGEAARVVVCGNPHLQTLAARHAERRAAIPADEPISRIRFFSENIHHYYPEKPVNEFVIVSALADLLAERGWRGELVVRPHPMESREAWTPVLEHLHSLAEQGVRVVLDVAAFDDALADNCIAVGLTSMALLETAICGIPTFSYQIDVPQDDGYFMLPFGEYGIGVLSKKNDFSQVLSAQGSIPQGNRSLPDAVAIVMRSLEKMLKKPGVRA